MTVRAAARDAAGPASADVPAQPGPPQPVTGPVTGPVVAPAAALRRAAQLLRLPRVQIWLLVALVALLSAALGALFLPDLPAGVAAPGLTLPVLVLLVALAELVRVHLHFLNEAHTITLAEVVLVLALLFAAPVDVLLAQVLGGLLARLVTGRQAPVKLAFNVSVAALDACVAVLVFRALVEVPAPADPWTWLAAALATGATTVSSSLLVAVVIAVSERQLERRLVLTTLRPAVAITCVNTAMGLALGVVLHLEPRAAVLLVLPATLTVVGYRAYAAQVEERHRVEVLLAGSRRLNTAEPLPARLSAGLELCRTTLRAGSVQLVVWPGQALPVPAGCAPDRAVALLAELVRDGVTRRYDGQRGDVLLMAHLRALGATQGMVAPMRSGDAVVGALVVVDRLGEVSRYGRQDQRLLDAVAEQVAVTLQHDALSETVQQLQAAQAQLRHSANHDPLTGLANRRRLVERLDERLAARRSGGAAPALVLLDLNGFKHVNDNLGHGTGDALLRVVADRLTEACRPGDLAARLGGDEFVVLLDGPLSEGAAAQLTARLQAAVCGSAAVDGHEVEVRASFGVTVTSASVTEAAQVLQRADHAMYQAKYQAKYQAQHAARHLGEYAGEYGAEHGAGQRPDGESGSYDAVDQARDSRRRALRRDLDTALDTRQIHVAYQPVVSVASGAVVGVEALARWQHPEHGAVAPEEFIAFAESTGQIVRLGGQVLLEACRQLAVWQRTTPRSSHSVSVNLSVRQLLEPGLGEQFRQVLANTGADPTRLVLEITESDALREETAIVAFLHGVRRLGVRVAIDDFGSGYASVSHLRRLPVDVLKLDRTLVHGALHSQADAEICRAIVSLAAALHLTVVAEGVETAEHAQLVAELGCPLVQGYHTGHPGSASDVEDLLLAAELRALPVRA